MTSPGLPNLVRRGASMALDFWFAPLDIRVLRSFGRVFALTFLIYMLAWLSKGGQEWLTDAGFHVSEKATSSAHGWPLPLLPGWAYWPFVVWLVGLSAFATAGLYGRWPFLLLVPTSIYVQMVDRYSAFTLNKLYVVGFFLLAVQASWLPRSNGATPRFVQSAWTVRVIQATLLIQYATAGVCKIVDGDWLQRHDILFGHSVGLYRTDIAAWVIQWSPAWTWVVLSQIALLFELFAPLWLGVRKLRPIGFVVGIGMHISIALLMNDLIYFSLQMICFYILFVPERWLVEADTVVDDKLGMPRPELKLSRGTAADTSS